MEMSTGMDSITDKSVFLFQQRKNYITPPSPFMQCYIHRKIFFFCVFQRSGLVIEKFQMNKLKVVRWSLMNFVMNYIEKKKSIVETSKTAEDFFSELPSTNE